MNLGEAIAVEGGKRLRNIAAANDYSQIIIDDETRSVGTTYFFDFSCGQYKTNDASPCFPADKIHLLLEMEPHVSLLMSKSQSLMAETTSTQQSVFCGSTETGSCICGKGVMQYLNKRNVIIGVLVLFLIVVFCIIFTRKSESEVQSFHFDNSRGGVTKYNFVNGELQSIEQKK